MAISAEQSRGKRYGHHQRRSITPLQIAMGRVERIFSGDDGFNCVAEVRTVNSTLRRALSRLIRLPVTRDEVSMVLFPGSAMAGGPDQTGLSASD